MAKLMQSWWIRFVFPCKLGGCGGLYKINTSTDQFLVNEGAMATAAAAVEVEEGRTGIPCLLRLSSAGEEAIASNVAQLIGWTPLVEMKNIAKKEGIQARLVGKMEAYQPLFSVKDRTALGMIEDAEKKGLITPGVTTLIEPTGGNLGTGLVLVAIQRGYRFIAVMPAGYSLDKQMLLRFLGAEVILTGRWEMVIIRGEQKMIVGLIFEIGSIKSKLRPRRR